MNAAPEFRNRIPGRGWVRGVAVLLLGLGLRAGGEEPGAAAGYPALFGQALSQVKAGQVAAGEARMREAVRQAEAAGDLASVYWNAWLLAKHRAAGWSDAQQLAWFEVAEGALERRDRNHFKWRIADLPNYIQLLCEKETVLARQGRRGAAATAHRKATDLARQYWGPLESEADLRRMTPGNIAIYLNLLLDQANHQELSGRMGACEATFQRALALAEGYLKSTPDYRPNMGRIANNYAVMLGLVGRDEEEDRYQAEALRHRTNRDDGLIAEANRLRSESREQGPSPDLLKRLLDKAARLEAQHRPDDALEIRRQGASILYEMGRAEEAEALFAQVIEQARAQGGAVVAAHALYWRAKARGAAGHPGAESDFLSALKAYRALGLKPYEGRLYQAYAIFLRGNGHLEEALLAVNEGVRLNRSMQLVHLRPELLVLKADILYQAGQVPAAEDTWREILELLRELPGYSPNRHLQVLVARLRHLSRSGREAELAETMAAARALIEAGPLTEYQARAFREFKPEDHPAGPAPAPAVDWPMEIQPAYTATHAPPGAPAQTWFWLLNPAAVARPGRLRVRGPGVATWAAVEPSRVEIEIRAGAEETVSERALGLVAEDVLAIRVSHAGLPDGAARFALEWDGDNGATAVWHVAGDADPAGTASTIHQHFAQQNPFFSVALYHEIGAEEGGGFRVRASAPCRVEVYDAESLALLAVDADGDGSFRGVGDLLAADANLDGHLDTDRSPRPVVLHVFPVPGERYEQPLDLVLEAWSGAGWIPVGSDRLIAMDAVAEPVPEGGSPAATP